MPPRSTMVTAVLLVLGTVAFAAGPPARRGEKMFPDGRDYDFGKVKMGTRVELALRLVNTSDGTLEVISLRVGMSPISARWSSKPVLQPNEAGTLEITVDTTRFLGRKTMMLRVDTKQGEVSRTFDFRITGVAERKP